MTTSHAIRKGFAKNISGIFLKKTAHGRVVEGRAFQGEECVQRPCYMKDISCPENTEIIL